MNLDLGSRTRRPLTSPEDAAIPARPIGRLVLEPLPITRVDLDPFGFWGLRRELNSTATIEHCEHWLERAGSLGNFDAAVDGRLPQAHQGRPFADSDVYKLLEAMGWEIGRTGDRRLEASLSAIVARIGAAQEPDGYLCTNYGRPGQDARYSDLEWGHELYNYGHLLQAAVARLRSHGRDQLVEIATRVADHVCEAFGPNGRDAVCGHPEIELGLVEFGRATGERRYVDQAALFVERRGRGTLADIEYGRAYYQDDMPVREAEVFRGHAVRALYLAAAAVDVAVDLGDDGLLAVIESQWERTVATRTYVTGGMGSHHQDEAFGEDFVLPSDRAYCETCAGIASVMLAWRLLLATGKPQYANLIERTLYNIVATSPGEDGRSFFYANTLHQRTTTSEVLSDELSPRASSSMRAPWFDFACCPTNLARTMASISGYIATTSDRGVQLHQYSSGTVRATTGFGVQVALRVETDYPLDGSIVVTVIEADAGDWTLTLRVPDWAHGALLEHPGGTVDVEPGSVDVPVGLRKGDRVMLKLPMTPRFTVPDERIDAVRGTVAIERGPVVHCLESVDLQPGQHVDSFVVDTATAPVDEGDGVVVHGVIANPDVEAWPYRDRSAAADVATPTQIVLVPYYSWANRGSGTMRIWLRASASAG